MAEPETPDYAALNGWDRAYELYERADLPSYVGLQTFCQRDFVADAAELARRQARRRHRRRPVRRRGQPSQRCPLRAARHPPGDLHPRRALAPARRRDLGRTSTSSMPATPTSCRPGSSAATRSSSARSPRSPPAAPCPSSSAATTPSPGRRHRPSPRRSRRGPSASSTSTPMPTPATISGACWPATAQPMRRLIESGAVKGKNFVQIGLRGYWPGPEVFAWMREQGMRWHKMTEIEERGAEAVIDDAIAEALDGPDSIYLSVDVDVIDPGMAPGTGTPEPGGMLTRELLAGRSAASSARWTWRPWTSSRSRRPTTCPRSPPGVAHRSALEALSALAVKKRDGPARPARRPAAASHALVAAGLVAAAMTAGSRGAARPLLRPRPAGRPRRPRALPGAGRGRRWPDPRAGRGHRSPGRPARPGRPRGGGGRRRSGDARPSGRTAWARVRGRRGSRRTGSTLVEARPPRRSTSVARFALVFIGLNSLLLLAHAGAPGGRAARRSPRTCARPGWPWSTSGCPTPTTWRCTTGG